MAEAISIWTRLAARLRADWQQRFDRQQLAIDSPINSLMYFTRRMDAAVNVFDELVAEGFLEGREAADRSVTSADLANPQQTADRLFADLLQRCIDTIQAQIQGGQARGMQNIHMLEEHANQATRNARERYRAQVALMAATLEQYGAKLYAGEATVAEQKRALNEQRRRDDRKFYADMIFRGLAVVGSIIAFVGPRWPALVAAIIGLLGGVVAWAAHSRGEDSF
jgi:hypothetical protein